MIFGGTLTPFEGTTFPGYYTPAGELKRQSVNAWIRTKANFDAVIDFDQAVRDPSHPTRLLPAYDCGGITCTPTTPATRQWLAPSI